MDVVYAFLIIVIAPFFYESQVTVARTGLTAEQIANNVKAAIKKVTECVPGGCDNIRNIHIKTPDSPSLPVYISFGKFVDQPKLVCLDVSLHRSIVPCSSSSSQLVQ